MIVGKSENFKACPFDQGISAEKLRSTLKTLIKDVDSGHGVIILTDMFGGTPSNISLSFLAENKVEVVTGINLPMLITALTKREGITIEHLAARLKEDSCSNVYIASEILATNLRK